MIGSDKFDEDDSDWACNEIFTTREDIFYFQRTSDIAEWEEGLKYVISMVKKYLQTGNYSNILKTYKAIGVGFVDGDIEIIYMA